MPSPKAVTDPFKPPFPTPRHAVHAYQQAAGEVTKGVAKMLDLADSPEAFHGLARDDRTAGLTVTIRKDAATLAALANLIEGTGGSLARLKAVAMDDDQTPF